MSQLSIMELVTQFEEDSDVLHDIVNLGVNAEAPTLGGSVRSFSKVLNDASKILKSQADIFIAQSESYLHEGYQSHSTLSSLFIGSASTDPTSELILIGMLHYNTSHREFRVFNGEEWQPIFKNIFPDTPVIIDSQGLPITTNSGIYITPIPKEESTEIDLGNSNTLITESGINILT